MKIKYRDGLLFTSLKIVYRGKSICIDNIVVDTGASQSLISQDCVEEIGVRVSGDDEVVTSYLKNAYKSLAVYDKDTRKRIIEAAEGIPQYYING